MDDSVDFVATIVVGRACGIHFGQYFLNRWAVEQWGDFLPRLNHTRVLVKGWFAFVFDSSNLVDRVLGLQWCMDGIPLFLK